jgi:hypothetical protein
MKTMLLAAAALALAAPVQAAELITNGGFEAGLAGGWTSSGQVAVNTAADYHPCCGTFGSEPAFTNNHFVDFGSGNTTGTDLVSQAFHDLAGSMYTVSFDLGAFGAGTNNITAEAGGVSQTFTVTANDNADTTFHPQTFSFLGTGTDFVKFTVVATGPDNTDALLDNVSVSGVAVPEPATWAMMLVGFGGLGAMLRRRRAHAFA